MPVTRARPLSWAWDRGSNPTGHPVDPYTRLHHQDWHGHEMDNSSPGPAVIAPNLSPRPANGHRRAPPFVFQSGKGPEASVPGTPKPPL